MPSIVWTEQRDFLIRCARAHGWSAVRIAGVVNVSPDVVRKRINALGLRKRAANDAAPPPHGYEMLENVR